MYIHINATYMYKHTIVSLHNCIVRIPEKLECIIHYFNVLSIVIEFQTFAFGYETYVERQVAISRSNTLKVPIFVAPK